jgi:uncharacterized iron-regulated protein
MTKEVQEPVVEAEFTEVNETEPKAVKCALTVGMTEEGNIFFDVNGSDQNLLLMEGLLKYAQRHMDRVWEGRLENQANVK